MKREPAYVGIDVAKDRVDIAVHVQGRSELERVLRGWPRGGGETGCQVAGEPSATIRPSGARNSRADAGPLPEPRLPSGLPFSSAGSCRARYSSSSGLPFSGT